MRLIALTLVASAALGALPAIASPQSTTWRTMRLNWKDSTAYTGKPLVTFTVAWLKTDGDRWQARVSFTNRSKLTLKIAPGVIAYGPGSPWGFWIIAPRVTGAVATQTFARPAFPNKLRPGATWSGIYGGTGIKLLPRHLDLSLTFGHFVDPAGNGFSWVSQRSLVLP